ncbi:RimK family alpha-L-glutamate ligase [Ideonella sp. 3Y2]|uniref:RimK family alpha-L-glutamate ligase n=2 Tax=Ideonella alba TaxID=2824118 RepID=A0A941BF41_9BURK|nr:RimK family alpha-L-glutamate ligase [Ideonella alba]MBQ0930662.1 RimK family alpha-L-glutamate ligase [Ideonella alba]
MTMRVAIMTDEVGWHTRQLQAALRARGAQGRCLDLADCGIDTSASHHGLRLPGFERALPEAVIVRGIAGGSFEQVTQRLGVLHVLRELGVPVYNDARAIERTVDKAMTTLLLHAAGLPTPPTWTSESEAVTRRIVAREAAAGHALVLKPLFGSQGRGLVRVGQVEGSFEPLPSLAGPPFNGLAYLQRWVPPLSEPGFDWRVLVIGGQARAAMQRVSGHWIHNIKQGARPVAAALTPELADLAERASAALGLDYAGVDILPTRDGLTVLEVNGIAAWQGLQRVTGFSIAQALVDDLLARRCADRSAARRA